MHRVEHDLRFLNLEGADNVRDLGGLPAGSGQQTRSKRLLRAEFTHALTEDDIQNLPGIRTAIDLRSKNEILVAPLPWPEEGVTQLHCPLPMLSGEELPRGDHDLVAAYLGYLEINPAPMLRAVRTLFDPANHAVLFYCAAGKDRTGTVSAMILDVLEVPREVIAADYALSDGRMSRISSRLAAIDIYRDNLKNIAPTALRAEPETILAFLKELDSRHGGPEQWLLSNGVQPVEIARFREAMLTDAAA